MMPAAAGQAAGFGCGDAAAGVEGGDAGCVEVGQALVEGHGDHDRGAAATGVGQGLAAMDSISSVNAMPSRTVPGRSGSIPDALAWWSQQGRRWRGVWVR